MDEIAAAHPGVVTLLDIGATYEGRRMRGVKISYGPGHKGIFIEANIHAREWISSATATFVINELLSSTNPSVRNIAESHDWYIFPVCNPDGYEFAHTNVKI
jgi:murein tripeptide amidase MpaA